jgi:hypothetical protein
MRHQPYKTGTLAGTQLTVTMEDAPLPANVWINSTAGGRQIEVSNDGTIFQVVSQYDTNITGQLMVRVLVGIAAVRFTGNVGDAWGVQ